MFRLTEQAWRGDEFDESLKHCRKCKAVCRSAAPSRATRIKRQCKRQGKAHGSSRPPPNPFFLRPLAAFVGNFPWKCVQETKFRKMRRSHGTLPTWQCTLFPHGDPGRHWRMELLDQERDRTRLDQLVFYRYHVHVRPDQLNRIFWCQRLFQQYVVDAWGRWSIKNKPDCLWIGFGNIKQSTAPCRSVQRLERFLDP